MSNSEHPNGRERYAELELELMALQGEYDETERVLTRRTLPTSLLFRIAVEQNDRMLRMVQIYTEQLKLLADAPDD